jgi:hypothetical protein
MLIYNKQNIIPASTVLNTNVNSTAMQLENMLGYAIQVVIAGTPTGTLKLQMSCDPVTKQNLIVGTNGLITYVVANWSDIANSSMAVSSAGTTGWEIPDAYYNFVRVVYTDGSGGSSTATISSATFNSKGY